MLLTAIPIVINATISHGNDAVGVLVGLLLAGAGLASEFVLPKLKDAKLRPAIDAEQMLKLDTAPRDNFIDAVVAELSDFQSARLVMVDAFDRLEEWKRRAIVRYLALERRSTFVELWIIFEDVEQQSFTRLWDSLGVKTTRPDSYKQDYLSPHDRERLANDSGVPERARNLAVGNIRPATAPRDEAVIQSVFADFKPTDEPAARDGFELFYLLLLANASAPAVRIGDGFLIKKISASQLVRSRLLVHFFPTGEISNQRVDNALRTWEDRRLLPHVTHEKLDRSVVYSFEEPDLVHHWIQAGHRMGLPNPKLGHLYLSLLWFNCISNEELDPAWISKLSTQLLEAGDASVPGCDIEPAVVQEILEAILFAIRGKVDLCLFNDLAPLIQMAERIVRVNDSPSLDSTRGEIMAWAVEAYLLTADDSLLKEILLSRAQGSKSPVEAATQSPADRLFVQSLPPQAGVDRVLQAVSAIHPRHRKDLRILMHARAGTIALSASPLLERQPAELFPLLSKNVTEALASADEHVAAAVKVTGGSGRSLTAMVALGDALWVAMLATAERNRRTEHLQRLVRLLQDTDAATLTIVPAERHTDLASLAAASTRLRKFVDLTHKSKRERGRAIQNPLLAEALAKVLATTIAASAVVAASSPGSEDTEGLYEIADHALRIVLSIEKRVWPLDRLVGCVDSAFSATDLMLQKIGLDQLAAQLSTRQFQFKVLMSDRVGSEYVHAATELVVRLDALKDETSGSYPRLIGLMTTAAACKKVSRHLAADFLYAAVSRIPTEPFGQELVDEVGWLSLILGSTYLHLDHSSFACSLAEGPTPRLPAMLQAVNSRDLPHVAQWLCNALSTKELTDANRDTGITVIAELRRRADLEPKAVRRDVSSIVSVFDLERRIDSTPKEVNPCEVFQEFFHNSSEPTESNGDADAPEAADDEHAADESVQDGSSRLPFVLHLLLHLPEVDDSECFPTIFEEAIETVRVKEVKSSGMMLLASDIAFRLRDADGTDDRREAAMRMLEKYIRPWENELTIDRTAQIYGLLLPRDQGFRPDLEKWQSLSHEKFRVERLNALLDEREYFTLFDHYVRALQPWGLKVVNDEYLTNVQYMDSGADDIGVVEIAGQRFVTKAFLDRGSEIIRAGTSTGARRDLNERARRGLERLFNTLDKLPSVPPPILKILTRQGEIIHASSSLQAI